MKTDGTRHLHNVSQEKHGKKRDMEAKASKHASKSVYACARARARVCVHVCVRARGLMAALPSGGTAEDGSELRSHGCGVVDIVPST
jgi:hypothetical protein